MDANMLHALGTVDWGKVIEWLPKVMAAFGSILDFSKKLSSNANSTPEAVKRTAEEYAKLVNYQDKKQLDAILARMKGTIQYNEMIDLMYELAELAERNGIIKKKPELNHSKFKLANNGDVVISLGQSKETEILNSYELRIDIEHKIIRSYRNGIPVYRVTMLGKSMAGKTVFLSSMYKKALAGDSKIFLRPQSREAEFELSDVYERIILNKKWPGGTTSEKMYDFDLIIKDRDIGNDGICAIIEWHDYRGGMFVSDKDHTDPKRHKDWSSLLRRCISSDIILWMIDLDGLPINDPNYDFGCAEATASSGIDRMHVMCSEVIAKTSHAQAWIFVRTKADKVRKDDDTIDWERALAQLDANLGMQISFLINKPTTTVFMVPVSAVGRTDEQNVPRGDGPKYVEWPLLLSYAHSEMIFLESIIGALDAEVNEANNTETTRKQSMAHRFRMLFSKTDKQLESIVERKSMYEKQKHELTARIKILKARVIERIPKNIVKIIDIAEKTS